MLIGRLIKPCKLVLYHVDEEGGEVESFSLLKLSAKEFSDLLIKAHDTKKEIEYTLDDSIVIKYSGNDELHQAWKDLCVEHQKNKPESFFDVSAEFKTKITGTSCLIRDAENHVIRIAKRMGSDKITINKICVDNGIRDRFFNDAKLSISHKTTGRYSIDTRDLNIYTYWSKFMNTSFINQYKEYKAEKAAEKKQEC